MNITTTSQQLTLNDQILEWLLNRKISNEQINASGIKIEDDGRICIPVRDETGKIIFNKYRRNPFSNEGSKYTYSYGSTASLFNAHTIENLQGETIFISEGELDCLLLNSLGLNAVSSTGGAGTFKEEWVTYFNNNNVYICFDKDEAGVRGALRVQEMIPHAKIILFPSSFKGKDITDYFQKNTLKQFTELVEKAESWNISKDPSEIPDKKGVDSIIKSLKTEVDLYMKKIQEANQTVGGTTLHLEIIKDKLNNRLESWNKVKKSMSVNKTFNKDSDDVVRARMAPITNYLKFNSSGFSNCPFHSDSTASFKYYHDNHCYCFGCSKRANVIDIVMKTKNLTFKEAIGLIVGKP